MPNNIVKTLQPWESTPQQRRLAFADLNFSLLLVTHQKQERAFRVRSHLFHLRQIDDRRAMRPKEHLFGQTGLEIVELIVDPVAFGRGISSDGAAVGAEEDDLFRRKKKETVTFTPDHLL